ncbi:hypothetical protein [Nitrososphaera sp.]|uniref:hypothetical protein n=1 Tax=Nitrososphaera sp. TaxID=1971748 RepID=UPI00307EA2A9
MAGADSFAVEQGRGDEAVKWMNEYAKKNKANFEAKLQDYVLQTAKFGGFDMISWKGDWPAARNIIKKASGKLRIKTLESGYHEKTDLLSSMFGASSEFAKVYSNGNLVGQIEMTRKSGKWVAKSEAFS